MKKMTKKHVAITPSKLFSLQLLCSFFLVMLFFMPAYSKEPSIIKLHTHFNSQYIFASRSELLNDANGFDAYSFLQITLDIGPKLTKEHTPLELACIARIKADAGNNAAYFKNYYKPIKIGWALTEDSYSNSIQKLLIGIRELWIKYSFNEDKTNFFSVGFFPYDIGSGFTLGNAYIMGENIAGLHVPFQIDQYRPGVMFAYSLTDQLHYNIYAGIVETASNKLQACGSYTNAQRFVPLSKPELGPFKSNYIIAAQGTWDIPIKTPQKGILKINPYLFFNSNNIQTVESFADANSLLFTPGIVVSLESNNLRITAEYAHNFGHQNVHAWDRNTLQMAASTYNTYLFYVNPNILPDVTINTAQDSNFSLYQSTLQPDNLAQNYANGEKFLANIDGIDLIFRNAYDRFRQPYRNNYKGWLLYSDILYNFHYVTWGAGTGLASGDAHPNDTPDTLLMTRNTPAITYRDYTKNYHGFVGIEQLDNNTKAINPLLLMQVQKMNMPLSQTQQLTTPLLSNLFFVGTSLSYHKKLGGHLIDTRCNLIGYFQPHTTYKGVSATYTEYVNIDFTPTMRADMTQPCDSYLGTELNLFTTYHLDTDIALNGVVAVFIPGSYYTDLAGKYIPLANQFQLLYPDATGMNDDPDKYNITVSNDTSIFISLGISCLF